MCRMAWDFNCNYKNIVDGKRTLASCSLVTLIVGCWTFFDVVPYLFHNCTSCPFTASFRCTECSNVSKKCMVGGDETSPSRVHLVASIICATFSTHSKCIDCADFCIANNWLMRGSPARAILPTRFLPKFAKQSAVPVFFSPKTECRVSSFGSPAIPLFRPSRLVVWERVSACPICVRTHGTVAA